MSKYKIGSEVQELTSTKGNQFKKFNIKDDNGVITEGAVCFSTYKEYAKVIAGAEVEGVLTESDYNGRKSFTLKDGNLGPRSFGGAANMERKEKSIEKFQDNKEYSIMVASTANMATQIMTALIEGTAVITEQAWKEKWISIRYWLVKNWENLEEKKVPGTDIVYPSGDIDPDSIPF